MKIDLDVIQRSYDFTIDIHGEIHGLTSGDCGFEPTGIKISGDTFRIWQLGCERDELNRIESEREDND